MVLSPLGAVQSPASTRSPSRLPRCSSCAAVRQHLDLSASQDLYPNQPNVQRYTVELNSPMFDALDFTTTNIGPFTPAIRTPPTPTQPPAPPYPLLPRRTTSTARSEPRPDTRNQTNNPLRQSV
ncbi:arabinofuranosyltransferase [Mycolicibacterium obuense]|uniref:arabinofuranosyltransferase n=1 Tax=Mycolicibacterium obuense TaxID=1807 RepID=UPI003C6E65F1